MGCKLESKISMSQMPLQMLWVTHADPLWPWSCGRPGSFRTSFNSRTMTYRITAMMSQQTCGICLWRLWCVQTCQNIGNSNGTLATRLLEDMNMNIWVRPSKSLLNSLLHLIIAYPIMIIWLITKDSMFMAMISCCHERGLGNKSQNKSKNWRALSSCPILS